MDGSKLKTPSTHYKAKFSPNQTAFPFSSSAAQPSLIENQTPMPRKSRAAIGRGELKKNIDSIIQAIKNKGHLQDRTAQIVYSVNNELLAYLNDHNPEIQARNEGLVSREYGKSAGLSQTKARSFVQHPSQEYYGLGQYQVPYSGQWQQPKKRSKNVSSITEGHRKQHEPEINPYGTRNRQPYSHDYANTPYGDSGIEINSMYSRQQRPKEINVPRNTNASYAHSKVSNTWVSQLRALQEQNRRLRNYARGHGQNIEGIGTSFKVNESMSIEQFLSEFSKLREENDMLRKETVRMLLKV